MVKRKSNIGHGEKLKKDKKDGSDKDFKQEQECLETFLRNNLEYETVRCLVCGTTDENYYESEDEGGDMIECETCLTWQHIDCVFLDDSQTRSIYRCEICEPDRSKFENLRHNLDPCDYFIDSSRYTRADFTTYMIKSSASYSGEKFSHSDYLPRLRSKAKKSLQKMYSNHFVNGKESVYKNQKIKLTQDKFATEAETYLFERLESIPEPDRVIEYLTSFDFLKALLTFKKNDTLISNLLTGKLSLKDIYCTFNDDFRSNPRERKITDLASLLLIYNSESTSQKCEILGKPREVTLSGNKNESPCLSGKQELESPTDSMEKNSDCDTLIWRGVLDCSDLSELPVDVRYSGDDLDLALSMIDSEKPIIVEGRVDSKKAKLYLERVKSEYKVVTMKVFSLEKEKLDEYYKYLIQKSRYGVIKSEKNYVKDIYLVPRGIEGREMPFLCEDLASSKGLSLAFVVNKDFTPELNDSKKTKANTSNNFLAEILDDQETGGYIEKIFKEFPESRYNLHKLHSIVEEKYQDLKRT